MHISERHKEAVNARFLFPVQQLALSEFQSERYDFVTKKVTLDCGRHLARLHTVLLLGAGRTGWSRNSIPTNS